MTFQFRTVAPFTGALFLIASVAAAQTADRLTDKDVKALFESVDQARDRFEDQLDGKVKNGVLRSATGETQISSSLDDFQQEIEKLKSRFTEKYAASAEAETVLRHANSLNTMMAGQPAGLKGANEWDSLRSELKKLAAAYRSDFPLPEGAPVRRINDAEAAESAGAVVAQAEALKRAAKADKTMAKADKEAIVAEADGVAKQAKTLQSRLKDGKPATADARALREKVAALTAGGRQLPAPVLTAIGAMRAPFQKLDQAFGLVPLPTS